MDKVLLFAGTTEGRILADYLQDRGIPVLACVATEYGKEMIPEEPGREVVAGRLGAEEMALKMEGCGRVVDATHPYASKVSKNIRAACQKCGKQYIRVLRGREKPDGCVSAADARAAAEYLAKTRGNILLTTGSKDIDCYTCLPDFEDRLYVRVLPDAQTVADVKALGIPAGHIIGMQGPFCEELNYAMIRQTGAEYLVTKESGREGGFLEKKEAAQKAGAVLLVIGRPQESGGMTLGEVKALFAGRDMPCEDKRHVSIIGCGMGSARTLTEEAARAMEGCDCLIGSKRLLEGQTRGALFACTRNEEIIKVIRENTQYVRVGVLVSGDPGFFSAAKVLTEALAEYDISVFCGVSSLSYFCAKIKTSWEDAAVISAHGRTADVAAAALYNQKTFVLTGKDQDAAWVCASLAQAGLGEAKVWVGENLGYEDERITGGCAAGLQKKSFAPLSVVMVINAALKKALRGGIPDEEFLRGNAPMTKFEVRCVSVAKMRISAGDTVYDIGAGTGAVSIEMAALSAPGRVYALEKNKESAELIQKNKKKFGAANLTVLHVSAPGGMEELPAPDCVFIGGSTGGMEALFDAVMAKNPYARLVVNAITLETLHLTGRCYEKYGIEPEITQITASRTVRAGAYHMMRGENPVFILSGKGNGFAK
jgi:precorrin-6Y C5,15-methyltransferase (decarboxylating)